jgi:hypothetical protein
MARVLLFGAGWMLLLAALTVGVSFRAASSTSTGEPPASVSPPAPPPRAGVRYPGWTVTRAYSAHHMMVVEVETDRAANGAAIAAQLVEPLKDRYDEVLIYIRDPGQRPADLPARRIQWTPRAGYVESSYRR